MASISCVKVVFSRRHDCKTELGQTFRHRDRVVDRVLQRRCLVGTVADYQRDPAILRLRHGRAQRKRSGAEGGCEAAQHPAPVEGGNHSGAHG